MSRAERKRMDRLTASTGRCYAFGSETAEGLLGARVFTGSIHREATSKRDRYERRYGAR